MLNFLTHPLNVIYYAVSAIFLFWHKVFGFVLGPGSGVGWALAVVFLVFTLRAVLFKPVISQMRSMRKMQEFAPEIQKLQKKYASDRQKMAVEMQKLQAEHGVSPLGGCLPVLAQIPVFIGLFQVLRSFNRPFLSAEANRQISNYFFSAADVRSFLDAHLFGVPLSAYITEPADLLARYGDITRWEIAFLAVPLTVAAGILTHLTARHSVERQTEAQRANPQNAIMTKLMLYLFPLGVVAGGPFFPVAILIYWLSNNLWTLTQQRVVFKKIEAEEAEQKQAAISQRQALAPRPGQKPSRPKKVGGPTDSLTDGELPAGADDGISSSSAGSSKARSPESGSNDAGPDSGSAGSVNGQSSDKADGPASPGSIQQRRRPSRKKTRKRR